MLCKQSGANKHAFAACYFVCESTVGQAFFTFSKLVILPPAAVSHVQPSLALGNAGALKEICGRVLQCQVLILLQTLLQHKTLMT